MIDVGKLRLARAEAQLLGGYRAGSAVEVAHRLVAVQGQDVRAAGLAIRARSTGLTPKESIDAGLVRTWLMRGTLQYVTAGDVHWLLDLLGPLNQAKDARRRTQLGLDDGLCTQAVAALPGLLADRPVGRDELRARLNAAGIVVPEATQAMPHLLAYAAAAGVLRLGDELSIGRPAYQPLGERTAEPLSREKALAELARRYVHGHGPTEPGDLAAWSGLSVRDAKEAFTLAAPEAPKRDAKQGVRLLGHFDPYLLGYADKSFVVPEPFTKRVRTGGGFVLPTVVVGGVAVATWSSSTGIVPFEVPFSADVEADVEAEVADITRFLEAQSPATA